MWQIVLAFTVFYLSCMFISKLLSDREAGISSRELCDKYAELLRKRYQKMVEQGKASKWWEERKLQKLEARLAREKEANPDDPDDSSYYVLSNDLKRELEVLSWD